MNQRFTVALSFDPAHSYGREALRGVYDYAAEHPHWDLRMFDELPDGQAGAAACDGIIGYFSNANQVEATLRMGKPVIACETHLRAHGLMRCVPDNVQVGRMAAGHLLDLGYRSLAFVGGPLRSAPMRFSNLRELGFYRAIRHHQQRIEISIAHWHKPTWEQLCTNDFVNWLTSLPTPTGIFAACDSIGARVIRMAKTTGIRIPEDMAVVAVDDDDLICEALRPTMSSINLNLRRVGRAAAQMLQNRMAGEPCAARHRIPPLGVTERQSTAVFAGQDPLVTAVMEYVRTNFSRPFTVDDLLDRFMVSRRTLELHLRRELGYTPLQAIRRVRLSHAKRLLQQTTMPIAKVASACGFEDQRHFSTVFRKQLNLTPSAFREQWQRETMAQM